MTRGHIDFDLIQREEGCSSAVRLINIELEFQVLRRITLFVIERDNRDLTEKQIARVLRARVFVVVHRAVGSIVTLLYQIIRVNPNKGIDNTGAGSLRIGGEDHASQFTRITVNSKVYIRASVRANAVRKAMIRSLRPIVRTEKKRLIEAVVGVHVPGRDDGAVRLAIEVALTTINDYPAVVAFATELYDRVIFGSIKTIFAGVRDVVDLQRYGSTDRQTGNGNDRLLSRSVILFVSRDVQTKNLVIAQDCLIGIIQRHLHSPRLEPFPSFTI